MQPQTGYPKATGILKSSESKRWLVVRCDTTKRFRLKYFITQFYSIITNDTSSIKHDSPLDKVNKKKITQIYQISLIPLFYV